MEFDNSEIVERVVIDKNTLTLKRVEAISKDAKSKKKPIVKP